MRLMNIGERLDKIKAEAKERGGARAFFACYVDAEGRPVLHMAVGDKDPVEAICLIGALVVGKEELYETFVKKGLVG